VEPHDPSRHPEPAAESQTPRPSHGEHSGDKRVKRVRRKRRHDAPRETFSKSRVVIYIAAVAAGFLVGFLLLTYVPQAYATWRDNRLLRQANEALEQENYTEATAAAQQVLAARPGSVAAFHVLADATERQHKPETVTWRAQIARAQPNNLDAQLNLASAALRFHQLEVARRALEAVPQRDRGKAAYHVVAGWLARAEGNERAVEHHFAAALEQEPENNLYQFNLAMLRIRSHIAEQSGPAREVLERLKMVPEFRAGSLRALLSDAIARGQLERADALAQELQMSQQVTFGDYLLALDLYKRHDQEKFAAVLDRVKPVAARDRGDLAALIDWMVKNGLAADALKWTERLPAEMTTVPPAAIAMAEAFVEVKNWSRLRRWTRAGAWGQSEFLRFAYQAFAARQMKQGASDTEADTLWRSAERAASATPEHEAQLARLATRWNMPAEAELLWQRVAKHPQLRREALDALQHIYRTRNDLRNLLQIARQLHESSPREPALAANYARLALLIEPSTAEAHRKAQEAYEAAPADVNTVVTYAFALYSIGRTNDGIALLEKLSHQVLLDPHWSAFAAVLLLDEHKVDEAKEYILSARKGPLFPEEQQLLEEALAKSLAETPITPAPEAAETPQDNP
jgi:predicted Zn-dependent protease